MIHGSESGSARLGVGSALLESGLHGQLLWMSNRTQQTLSEGRGGLLYLQGRLIQHYFRLQQAERNLSHLAQSVRPPGGSSAVRQLELERQRLGRELHTGVGQLLAAIRLQLEIVATQLPNPPAAVGQTLQRIATLAGDALEQVRAVSRRLHPPEWQRLTLEAALQQVWEISGIPEKFDGTLRIDPLPREPEQEVKVLVYRAAQEALSNLTRHSGATRVTVTLAAQGPLVVLTVQDNGVGFDVDRLLRAPANVASGIGLRSVREQAAELGGNLTITSGPEGTTLELKVPFVTAI